MALAELTEDDLENMQSELEDYQITHGSLLKIPRTAPDLDSTVAIAQPVGISIIPTAFPRAQFNRALEIQPWFNELYIKVAEDESWLGGVVQKLQETDPFAATLWRIWERARDDAAAQPIRCGIFRSDYMLHHSRGEKGTATQESVGVAAAPQLKQVEFNTYSCAGASHANIVADMHRYLAARGAHKIAQIQPSRLPENNSIQAIVASLEAAHRLYDSPAATERPPRKTAVLMTVQPDNVNICDERPIEYALSRCDPPIALFRVEFGRAVTQTCTLGPSLELLFQPPRGGEAREVSVLYQRAGYDPREYTPQGIEARHRLESSRAIKCPSLLAHMSGFKKVQQELARPGALERFVPAERARALRATFMPLHPLDGASAEGAAARGLALDEDAAAGYVLKPSLEGGGHNVHGARIPGFLAAVPERDWGRYILMGRIDAPRVQGVLVSPLDTYRGPVVSELGALGTCLWRRRGSGGGDGVEILRNAGAGWTFKTKSSRVDEMSVVKGYGCFDCPFFADDTGATEDSSCDD